MMQGGQRPSQPVNWEEIARRAVSGFLRRRFNLDNQAIAEGDLITWDATNAWFRVRTLLTAIAHAMTSAAHTAGTWKVFYSNGSGAVTELALAAAGVLQTGGAAAAPAFTLTPTLGAGTGTGTFGPLGTVNVQTSAAGVGNTADTNDDTLFTYSLPLNSMSANGKSVRVLASGHFATTANTKRVKLWFAGTVIADSGAVTLSNVDWVVDMEVTRIDATHVSCVGKFIGSNVADVVTVTPNLAVSDLTANASILKVTGSSTIVGAANDILGYFMRTDFAN